MFHRRGASASPVLWYADAEASFANEWAGITDPTYPSSQTSDLATLPTSRTSVDTAQKASGAASYKLTAQDADTDFFATSARRTEIALGNPTRTGFPTFARGEERWIGYQMRIGTNFPTAPGQFTPSVNGGFPEHWSILTQFKQLGSLGSPIHYLTAQNDRLISGRVSNDPTNELPGFNSTTVGTYFRDLGPAVKNAWIKLLLHTQFDSDATKGFIEWFGDLADGAGYRQLLTKTFQATQKISDGSDGLGDTGQTRGCHLRVGLYHDKGISLATGTAELWFDRCVIATTRSAAEAKAFS
jgi:hypothetical protein